MVLALGECDFSLKGKYYALGISMIKPKYMVRQMQKNTAFLCLLDFTIREDGSTNVALKHLSLKPTSKGLGKEEAQFNGFNKSCIWGFGNTSYQGYGKT